MLSDRTAAALDRRNIHYGWVIAGVAFCTMLITSGTMGLPGAFIAPLTREFGWSTASISTALAIRLMLFGMMAPFSAAFIDIYGMRRVVLVAVTLMLVAVVLSPLMTQLWHLVVLWGFMFGIGSGMTALVLGALVANRWFVQRRGLVLGLLTASSATGQLAFLPLGAWLESIDGWRVALIPSAVALSAVAVLVFAFMRDRPADVGLRAFGESATAAVRPQPMATGNPFARAFGGLFEGARNPTFWILFGTFFVCGLSTAGLIQTHFITFCGDYGMAAVEAASVLAMMGMFDFAGTVVSGYLSDRFDNRWLLFFYYGLRGLSLLYLPYSTFTFYGLSIFAMFYGLDWFATVPPTVRMAGSAFGREKASVIFGWIFCGHQVGAASVAFLGGLSRTVLSTYLPAFYGAGIACLIAAFAVLLIGRSLKPRIDTRAPQPAAG